MPPTPALVASENRPAHVRPKPPLHDVANVLTAQTEGGGDLLLELASSVALADGHDLGFGQDVEGVALTILTTESVLERVLNLSLLRSELKIVEPTVRFVSVNVIDGLSGGGGTEKRQGHQKMHAAWVLPSVDVERHLHIAIGVRGSAEHMTDSRSRTGR